MGLGVISRALRVVVALVRLDTRRKKTVLRVAAPGMGYFVILRLSISLLRRSQQHRQPAKRVAAHGMGLNAYSP